MILFFQVLELMIGIFADIPQGPAMDIKMKREPSLTEVRQASMRRKQVERRNSNERWRFETPPLSSVETVKKRRWPPQYVSPPPTPHPQKSRSKTHKRRNIGGTLRDERVLHSPSPEILSVRAVTSPSGLRRSTRGKSVAHSQPCSSPKTPRKAKLTLKMAPNSPKSTMSPHQPPGVDRPVANDVTLHFFLSDESLGAIPVALSQCSSSTRFFEQAGAAWGFLDPNDGKTHMAGVSVAMEGLEWPLIVAWKSLEGHKIMMDTIETAKLGKNGDLLVKVKCIRK